jgi:hypothetical protein
MKTGCTRWTLAKAATVALVLGSLVLGCGGSSGPATPKKTVTAFFEAMRSDDKAALAHLLDLAELMRNTDQDYALSRDSARVFTTPEDILNDLTGDGLTKQRWFSMQRIVNETALEGETATVQVTFVDKEYSRGYITYFGLHKVRDKWRIYSFKTVDAAPSAQN